jgi:CRISPR-associated endonuclease Cas1
METPPRPLARSGGMAQEGVLPMQSQTTPSPIPISRDGVCVVDGYGIELKVERGHLVVADGIGPNRRWSRFSRATSGIRRLVLLGHTGFISLDALRWLADTGIGLVQLDPDGRLLIASAGMGRDDPRLRRAQALAIDTPIGDDIARRLIAEKIAAQATTLARLTELVPITDEVIAAMRDAASRLHVSTSRDEIRLAEAQAAAAYWSAWSTVGLRFATRDVARVPEHWRTFGTRASPLTGTSRVAANPANAVLNYLYAILEAEARLACLVLGLDPGLGVLHGDLKARDSLALDVLEPVRPQVDTFVLDLLHGHIFRAADFHQTRQGACRILEPLTDRLAETGPAWARALGPVAERVVALLTEGRTATPARSPTPMTGANRSRGRSHGVRARQPAPQRPLQPRSGCRVCGTPVPSPRRYCDACLPEATGQQRAAFVSAGHVELRRERDAGADPSHGGDAGRRRGVKVAASRRMAAAWQRSNGPVPKVEVFRREVLPLLTGVSAARLAELTGLSRPYCATILRGERVPHARWWEALRAVGRDRRSG